MFHKQRSLTTIVKNERETVIALLIALTIFILIDLLTNIDFAYNQRDFGTILTEISGTLLGLSLTSFAILIGLVPVLGKDLLKTNAFRGLGNYFQILFIFQAASLIIGLIIISSGTSNFLVFLPQIQLYLFLASLVLLCLFGYYLRLLFNRAILNMS